jgi:type IV pilus assembly protein PilY1
MATYGNGNYYSTTTYEGLVLAFEAILSEIQSVNSVFASVSLPVSVNTQGTYLNQVFIGMFRPDADALPRWAGNLKQYRMGMLNGALQLLDANEAAPTAAISNSGTGFIAECARSYWTPTEDDEYWANFKRSNCQGRPAISNTPDGNVVEKGGQGYRLRGLPNATSISRTVTTCSPTLASCIALTDFNADNPAITQALVDSSPGATNRTDLINWAIGLNNNKDEDFVAETAMRASAHGDVVHSRPVALNFGTEDLPNVVVFYGANDGMLRAINGNRTAAIGSIPAGGEIWSFMAPEFYGQIKRLRDNSTAINFPRLDTSGKLPKPYGFDGPITAYKDDENAWIYATMRRGGRAVYAFNVDVENPTNISLKWKRGCDDSGCSGGMSEIGQTWSTPQILKSSGYEGGAQPMIIMGGGYDVCEDVDDGTVNNACTSSSKGNRIYVLDAEYGTLLNDPDKPLITERGIVGNVTVVPDENGLAKYAYAADLGGNVYRINIGSAPPEEWTLTKIASLGCDDPMDECKANRKFMFGPDVIEEGGTTYLLLGSGDREKPLTDYEATTKVENRFYMIKDKPNESTWLTSETDNCGLTVICEASLTLITAETDPLQSVLDESKGWYLTMRASEQVVTSPITIYGVVTFSTHQPAVIPDGACSSNLGEAWVYNVRYVNAASANGTALRYQPIAGDGLPPSPVAGLVTLDDVDGKKTVPFVIGASPDSPLQVVPPPAPPPGTAGIQPKSRVYWYIQQ